MNNLNPSDTEKIIFTGEGENEEIISLDNILNDLDIEETLETFRNQIMGMTELVEDELSPKIDYFTPLYKEYIKAMEYPNADQDVVKNIQLRMLTITKEILTMLNQVFDLQVDIDNLNNDNTIISTTLSLYKFFIVHFSDHVTTVIENYIEQNSESLENNFSELTQKKDIVTSMIKKHVAQPIAVIVANIYDVTDFILCNIDTDNFIEFLDGKNIEANIIRGFVKTDIICGEFSAKIADIIKANVSIRSTICFDIMLNLRDKNPISENSTLEGE